MAKHDEPTALEYLRPLNRWRWLILAIVVFATAASYAYYDREPEVYQSSTRVLLGSGSASLNGETGGLGERQVQNLLGLLTSSKVVSRAAERLGRPGDGSLAGRVVATTDTGSDFVVVNAVGRSPQEAADIANAFGQVFIDLLTETRSAQLDAAIAAQQSQLRTLDDRPENATIRAQLTGTLQELRLQRRSGVALAEQIDQAPPGARTGTGPRRRALMVLVISLVASIGLAYALQSLDRRPRESAELAPLYGVPLLSAIPHVEDIGLADDGGITVAAPLKEPLRLLRTNLQLAAPDEPFKRILFTSALAGEGKSTILRNLAVVLVEGGVKVAIVDADLRRPTLAAAFGLPVAPGLTDVLTGNVDLDSATTSVAVEGAGLATLAQMGAAPTDASARASITLLPSGAEPADPQAVLSASRTRQVLDDLSATHDVVLIDSPPLLHVTDAVSLAPWADAIVVVARLGRATRDGARRVPEMLSMAGRTATGVVVNDVPAEQETYGYYGVGYGYGPDDGRRGRG